MRWRDIVERRLIELEDAVSKLTEAACPYKLEPDAEALRRMCSVPTSPCANPSCPNTIYGYTADEYCDECRDRLHGQETKEVPDGY